MTPETGPHTDLQALAELPDVPDLPATGDGGVDVALAPLASLPGLPVAAHAEVYDQVHRGLQGALAGLDRA